MAGCLSSVVDADLGMLSVLYSSKNSAKMRWPGDCRSVLRIGGDNHETSIWIAE
jgi:hypothetical protein